MTSRPSLRSDRVGWGIVAVMTTVVAATWLPFMTGPLAANHLGNVAARYGLQVRNLYERGLLGSDLGADWRPYRSTAYAHHPPLLNILDAIVGLVPGDGTYQLRIAPVLLALAVIPASAALLRSLDVAWPAALLSIGILVATPMFWVYGPVMFDLGVIAALAAAVVRVRAGDDRLLWWATGLAVVVTLASWPGVAFGWALVGWTFAGRGRDRSTVIVAAGAAVGTALSLGYVFGVSGWSALVDQTETRTGNGSFGLRVFMRTVGGHLDALLPTWYLVALVPAVVVGVFDRRTRFPTAVAAVFALAWLIVLNQGAQVHDYWGYLLLAPGLLGTAAALHRGLALAERQNRFTGSVLVVGVAAVVTVTFLITVLGGPATEYLRDPGAGGRAVAEVTPPPTQTTAWIIGFRYGRILSYTWDLPVRDMSDLEVGQVDPDDVIVIDTRRLPDWWPSAAPPTPTASGGDVLIVTAGALATALENDPTDL